MTAVSEFYGNSHIGLRFGVQNANHTTPLGHSGQDINGWPEGTWIPSFAAGRVVNKVPDGGQYNDNDLGNFIVIQSNIGGVTYFVTHCHLASLGGTPNVGDWVQFGQGVGPIGNTGYSFGTHDHIMMSTTSMYPTTRVNLVDPLPFIYAARNAAAGGDVTPFPPAPTPKKGIEMIILKCSAAAPNARGNWWVGPGYARHIPSSAESTQADALVSAGIYDVKDCGTNYAAFDLIWSGHTNISPFQDINVGGGVVGGFTTADRAMLDAIPNTAEINQALTSTVQLVNDHADELSYDVNLTIQGGTTATGTATPNP